MGGSVSALGMSTFIWGAYKVGIFPALLVGFVFIGSHFALAAGGWALFR